MSINQMAPPQQIQNQQVYVNNPYQQQQMLQQVQMVQMINPHQQVQQGQEQTVQALQQQKNNDATATFCYGMKPSKRSCFKSNQSRCINTTESTRSTNSNGTKFTI
jgi:hypothetical protein